MELIEFELNFDAYGANDITKLTGQTQYVINGIEKEIVFHITDTKVINTIFSKLTNDLFFVEEESFTPVRGNFYHVNTINKKKYLEHVQACFLSLDKRKEYESINNVCVSVYGADFTNSLREVLPEKEEDIL